MCNAAHLYKRICNVARIAAFRSKPWRQVIQATTPKSAGTALQLSKKRSPRHLHVRKQRKMSLYQIIDPASAFSKELPKHPAFLLPRHFLWNPTSGTNAMTGIYVYAGIPNKSRSLFQKRSRYRSRRITSTSFTSQRSQAASSSRLSRLHRNNAPRAIITMLLCLCRLRRNNV